MFEQRRGGGGEAAEVVDQGAAADFVVQRPVQRQDGAEALDVGGAQLPLLQDRAAQQPGCRGDCGDAAQQVTSGFAELVAVGRGFAVPWAVQAQGGVGIAVEHEAERGAAFVAGPAVLAAFEFADPARVDVVRGEVPAGIELGRCYVCRSEGALSVCGPVVRRRWRAR
ncbi:hypothetical protein [Dactylosporangium sp. NPDC005555]|uniref:hypothetical protein n=1 Tax=Dactylosporangium sp. NPDC005555 TaxID=3154889 RepID=UPI0033B852B5